MSNWFDVFKLKQINIGTTKLSNKEIPEEKEEDDCCMEAAQVWVDTYNEIDAMHYGGSDSHDWPEHFTVDMLIENFLMGQYFSENLHYTHLNRPSDFCKQFREVLEVQGRKDYSYPHIAKFQRALWAWEDCEK